MNRRTVLTASAALPAAALPVTAMADEVGIIDPAAIRGRIAQVVETFRRATFAFPEPMSAEEAATALAFSDAEIRDGDVVIDFGQRWGVCLDWLVLGKIDGLLIDGRIIRESERARVASRRGAPDPAVTAYRTWVDANAELHAAFRRKDDEATVDAIADEETAAQLALAQTTATTLEGLEGQIRASFDVFGYIRRDGDPRNPDDYGFGNSRSDIDGQMLRSILAGAAGLVAREHGAAPSYVRRETAQDVHDRRAATLQHLPDDIAEDLLNVLKPARAGDVETATANYLAQMEQIGQPPSPDMLQLIERLAKRAT